MRLVFTFFPNLLITTQPCMHRLILAFAATCFGANFLRCHAKVPNVEREFDSAFIFLSISKRRLDLSWMGRGTSEKGEGVFMQSLERGGVINAPSVIQIKTSDGHAFRLLGTGGTRSSKKFVRSKLIVNTGGVILVGVRDGPDSEIDVEVLDAMFLKAMIYNLFRDCPSEQTDEFVRCATGRAKFPAFRIQLPPAILKQQAETWSPFENPPYALSLTMIKQSLVFLPNRLIFLNGLPTPLTVHWHFFAADADDPRAKSLVSSRRIAPIPPANPETGEIGVLHVKASSGQVFTAHTPSGTENVTVFYPGELGVFAIYGRGEELASEFLDEDDFKVLIGTTARDCADKVDDKMAFFECLGKVVKLPESGLLLPELVSVIFFGDLWTSISHWSLCVHQKPSKPIGRKEFVTDSGIVNADVLREAPLVLALHDVVSPQECLDLKDLIRGPLSRAYVDGGKTIRGRRTLSQDMNPDLVDVNSTLTRLTLRFFDLARQATGYEVYPEGQEPINWLYYKSGYEYQPHCDGECGATSVDLRSRVLTTLVYCEVAEDGGSTVFPNDKLKFSPTIGSMLLFTYNPDPQRDSHHAACPVLKGEKTTVTQWYREGMTLENNWESKQTKLIEEREDL